MSVLISRGVAVVKNQDDLAFIKATTQGLIDIKGDNTMTLSEAEKRLVIQ